MLSKEKLRKADLFTGALISLLGLWIINEAFKMPMKDSYGGVQNVWYVSPALFPIITGLFLFLLGLLLIGVSLRVMGLKGSLETIRTVASQVFQVGAPNTSTIRFLNIVCCFVFFIFMNIPRVDFVICSTLFLLVFIQSFYPDDADLLKKLFRAYFLVSLGFAACFVTGLGSMVNNGFPYSMDLMTAGFVAGFAFYAFRQMKDDEDLRRKFKTGLIVALLVPAVLGPVFKYRLLVPLPYEGIVSEFMDFLVYDLFEG